MFTQCIKKNLQVSYFAFLIIYYTAYCFVFGIVFCMCASYKVGRQVLQSVAKYSFSLLLSVNVCYVNSIMRVWVGLCNNISSQNFKNGRLLGHIH